MKDCYDHAHNWGKLTLFIYVLLFIISKDRPNTQESTGNVQHTKSSSH